MAENDIEKTRKQVALLAKVLQGFFLALFFLGVSTGVGDIAVVINLPISPFSVSSMTYGILGMLGCEYVSRQFSG